MASALVEHECSHIIYCNVLYVIDSARSWREALNRGDYVHRILRLYCYVHVNHMHMLKQS